MNSKVLDGLSRRAFICKTAAAGTAMYLGLGHDLGFATTEPPPETTRWLLRQWKPACWVPFHVAEPLLHEEGFTDIQWVTGPGPEYVKM